MSTAFIEQTQSLMSDSCQLQNNEVESFSSRLTDIWDGVFKDLRWPVINTNFRHVGMSNEYQTFKRGVILPVSSTKSRIVQAYEAMANELKNELSFTDANAWLQNFPLTVVEHPTGIRLAFRGGATMLPEGFDVAKANFELTRRDGPNNLDERYGGHLVCVAKRWNYVGEAEKYPRVE